MTARRVVPVGVTSPWWLLACNWQAPGSQYVDRILWHAAYLLVPPPDSARLT